METKQSIKKSIYDSLMEGIIHGEYRPNQILTEAGLLEKFDCSRAPIREALAALCTEGIMRNLPRCGYEVVRITTDDVNHMQEFRRILECVLLRHTAQTITPSRLAVLRQINEKCNSSGESMWGHWEYNAQFHMKLASYSQNDYAVRMLEKTLSTLKCAYGQFYWDKWDHLYHHDMKYHASILRALETGDGEEAARNMELDLQDFAAFS